MIVLGGLPREVVGGLLAQRKTDGIAWLSWLNNWQKWSTGQEVNREGCRQAPIAKSLGGTCSLLE